MNTKSLILIIGFISLLCVNTCFAGKVYVHRNADGVLVFSDAPKSDKAEEIKLNSSPTVVRQEDTRILQPTAAGKVEKQTYTISIVQPLHEATVRDNTGTVHIQGQIAPSISSQHKVRILVDGKQHGSLLSYPRQMLSNVYRGAHTLKMELVDKTGKVIASSEQVTFFMHRASVN